MRDLGGQFVENWMAQLGMMCWMSVRGLFVIRVLLTIVIPFVLGLSLSWVWVNVNFGL